MDELTKRDKKFLRAIHECWPNTVTISGFHDACELAGLGFDYKSPDKGWDAGWATTLVEKGLIKFVENSDETGKVTEIQITGKGRLVVGLLAG